MKKMILIAALTLVLTAAAVPGVAASFAENAGVSACFIFGDMIEAIKVQYHNVICTSQPLCTLSHPASLSQTG